MILTVRLQTVVFHDLYCKITDCYISIRTKLKNYHPKPLKLEMARPTDKARQVHSAKWVS